MTDKKILIGLVGHPSSGKDAVADYLARKHGFAYVSTGDMIREHMKERGLGAPARELMKTVSRNLRAENGADFLVRKALEENKNSPRLILGGLRALAEGEAVKKLGGIIAAVTASVKTRFQRAQRRKRIGDGTTFEEFKAREDAESVGKDEFAQNVNGLIAMADYKIENDGGKKDLGKVLNDFCRKII